MAWSARSMPSIPARRSWQPTRATTEASASGPAEFAVRSSYWQELVVCLTCGDLPIPPVDDDDHSPDPTTYGRDPVGDEGRPTPGRPSEHDPSLERPGSPALLPDQPPRRPALPSGRPAAIPRCRRSRRHGQLAIRPGWPTRP